MLSAPRSGRGAVPRSSTFRAISWKTRPSSNPWRGLPPTARPTCERPAIAKLVAEHGIEAMTFKAGSVMFMNCNLVHASPENLTPKRRTIVYVNANSVENKITKLVRATHHANRDFTPLVALADDCLVELAHRVA